MKHHMIRSEKLKAQRLMQEDENVIEEVEQDIEPTGPGYFETILYGLIEGTTAFYSETCRGGLMNTINGVFRMVDHIELWLPHNTIKFGMSANNAIEATNTVFAFCDFTHMYNEVAKLTVYTNWEQYIIVAGRIGGTMISDFWKYYDCIEEAKQGENGYTVGLCSGKIVTLFMDSIL